MLYELFCLISSKIEEKNIPSVIEKIEGIIVDFKGIVSQKENLGERKLAYSIKKEKASFGLIIYFEVEPQVIKPLEEKLKTIPEIIRFQVVKAEKSKLEKKKEKEENKTEEIKPKQRPLIFDKLDI